MARQWQAVERARRGFRARRQDLDLDDAVLVVEMQHDAREDLLGLARPVAEDDGDRVGLVMCLAIVAPLLGLKRRHDHIIRAERITHHADKNPPRSGMRRHASVSHGSFVSRSKPFSRCREMDA
jgi:hypothetical protein